MGVFTHVQEQLKHCLVCSYLHSNFFITCLSSLYRKKKAPDQGQIFYDDDLPEDFDEDDEDWMMRTGQKEKDEDDDDVAGQRSCLKFRETLNLKLDLFWGKSDLLGA